VDEGGNELIPVVNDSLIQCSNKSFIVKAIHKYGVIDSANYLIFQVEFDGIDHVEKNGLLLSKSMMNGVFVKMANLSLILLHY